MSPTILRRGLHALLLSALLIGGTAARAATCTSVVAWGSLGPPDIEFFGNTFSAPGTGLDCYTFSLTGTTNAFGGTIELNTLFNTLDLVVDRVALYAGGVSGSTTGSLVDEDTSPLAFSFSSLLAGNFTLGVATTVTRGAGLWTIPVGYAGLISTVTGSGVPEPGTLGLLTLGLIGLRATRRQRGSES